MAIRIWLSFGITFPKWKGKRFFNPGPLGLQIDAFTALFANEPGDIGQSAIGGFDRVMAVE